MRTNYLVLIGVLWWNLTMSGIRGVKNYIATFLDAFISFSTSLVLRLPFWEFDILKNFRGVAKPRAMVLVLGQPGSGCTTF